jgi:hypothetical protein
MEEDNYQFSDGNCYGLVLQKIKNSRIINNAIEMRDSSQYYPAGSNKFSAAVFYQGPTPQQLKNEIDYNIYNINNSSFAEMDIYRYISTELDGSIVDLGYREEFRTINN